MPDTSRYTYICSTNTTTYRISGRYHDTSGDGMYLVLDHWIHYTLQMVWWIPYRIPLDVLVMHTTTDPWYAVIHLVLDHWIHYTVQMVWWIPYQVPLDMYSVS